MGTAGRRAFAALATVLAVAGGLVTGAAPAFASASEPLAIAIGTGNDHRVLQETGTAQGSSVVAANYAAGDVGRQRWTLELLDEFGEHWWRIRSAESGRCLDRDPVAGDEPGSRLIVSDCQSDWTPSQLWAVPDPSFEPPYEGVQLINLGSSYCADTAGHSTADGAGVVLGGCLDAVPWKVRHGVLACDLYSNDRINTAMCFSTFPTPSYGVFANWKSQPITYEPLDPADFPAVNLADNYLSFGSLDSTFGNGVADGVEYGLHSEFDPDTHLETYSTYWTEWNEQTEHYEVLNTGDGSNANGLNHTYMVLSNANSTQWDVLYDYNPVGSTTLQEGGRLENGNIGLAVRYPQGITLSAPFNERLQIADGNRTWRRPYLGETGRAEPKTCNEFPTIDDPMPEYFNLPPYCLTTSLSTIPADAQYPIRADVYQVGKPAANSVAPNGTAPRPDATGTVNGVDQRQLAACLAGAAPERCTDTVPGLAACVSARKLCNTAAAAPAKASASLAPFTAERARAAAGRRLGVDASKAAVVRGSAGDQRLASPAGLAAARPADTPVLVVAGDGEVPSLGSGHHGRYHGYRLVFDARTGLLLHACLGQNCA
jgi:hypothetical protein